MRPIKFRVWDRAHECYCSDENHILAAGALTGELPHYSLEQFTGLLDKNGKEIYEGDIVIFWLKGESKPIDGKPVPVYFKDMAFHPGPFDEIDFEIIANIHETK